MTMFDHLFGTRLQQNLVDAGLYYTKGAVVCYELLQPLDDLQGAAVLQLQEHFSAFDW